MKLTYDYPLSGKVEVTIDERDLYNWARGALANKTGKKREMSGTLQAKVVKRYGRVAQAETLKGELK